MRCSRWHRIGAAAVGIRLDINGEGIEKRSACGDQEAVEPAALSDSDTTHFILGKVSPSTLALRRISLPPVLNDGLQARISGGRMTQSGRQGPKDASATATGSTRPILLKN